MMRIRKDTTVGDVSRFKGRFVEISRNRQGQNGTFWCQEDPTIQNPKIQNHQNLVLPMAGVLVCWCARVVHYLLRTAVPWLLLTVRTPRTPYSPGTPPLPKQNNRTPHRPPTPASAVESLFSVNYVAVAFSLSPNSVHTTLTMPPDCKWNTL